MADVDVEPEVATGAPKKRTFRKYSYRCIDLDALHGRHCPALPRASPLLALPARPLEGSGQAHAFPPPAR
jgi:hypothetical protein